MPYTYSGTMNELCMVCSRKWGKSLTIGVCHCTGHVSLTMPPLYLNEKPPHWSFSHAPQQSKAQEETGPKIGKKEAMRLERAMGRKV